MNKFLMRVQTLSGNTRPYLNAASSSFLDAVLFRLIPNLLSLSRMTLLQCTDSLQLANNSDISSQDQSSIHIDNSTKDQSSNNTDNPFQNPSHYLPNFCLYFNQPCIYLGFC